MNVKELFDAGDLAGAIDALTAEVKAHPLDAARRTFLFELLAFAGQYERAVKQLEVVANQDVESDWATQVYLNIVHAEEQRERLFNDGLRPEFLLDEPPYVHWHLEAINCLRDNRPTEAQQLIERSEESRETPHGTVDGARSMIFGIATTCWRRFWS